MASAAILAGGRARRFGGADKSAIAIHGQSILDRQLGELFALTDDVMIVGRAADRPLGATPVASRVRRIDDRVPRRGPLGGLDAALAAARDDVVAIVACDMPFVTAPLLRYMVDLAADADAVVPWTDRGYHPLCAVYVRRCQAAVSRRLQAGQLAMRDLLNDVRVRRVEPAEIERFGRGDRLLANVNTPGELRDLEALLGHEL